MSASVLLPGTSDFTPIEKMENNIIPSKTPEKPIPVKGITFTSEYENELKHISLKTVELRATIADVKLANYKTMVQNITDKDLKSIFQQCQCWRLARKSNLTKHLLLGGGSLEAHLVQSVITYIRRTDADPYQKSQTPENLLALVFIWHLCCSCMTLKMAVEKFLLQNVQLVCVLEFFRSTLGPDWDLNPVPDCSICTEIKNAKKELLEQAKACFHDDLF